MAKQKEIPLQEDWTLDEHENEIVLNEAASWELQSIKDNRATLKRLIIGDRPNRVRLRLADDDAPDDCEKLFDCELTVESKPEQVTVYREKS